MASLASVVGSWLKNAAKVISESTHKYDKKKPAKKVQPANTGQNQREATKNNIKQAASAVVKKASSVQQKTEKANATKAATERRKTYTPATKTTPGSLGSSIWRGIERSVPAYSSSLMTTGRNAVKYASRMPGFAPVAKAWDATKKLTGIEGSVQSIDENIKQRTQGTIENELAKMDKQTEDIVGDNETLKFANQASEALGTAIQDLTVTLATGGWSKAPQAAKAATVIGQKVVPYLANLPKQTVSWMRAAKAYGDYYTQSVAEGASEAAANARALTMAVIQPALEALGGVDFAIKQTAEKGISTILQTAVKSSATEALESPLQGMADRASRSIYTDVAPYSTTDESAIINPNVTKREAALGGTVGALGGSIAAGINAATSARSQSGSKGATIEANVPSTREALNELVNTYGAIPPGMDPRARNIELPRQTTPDNRVSNFARTAAESDIPEQNVTNIENAVANGGMNLTYEPIRDVTAKRQADNIIASSGPEKALEQWRGKVVSNSRITKEDMVLGETLLTQAAQSGNIQLVDEIIADIALAGRTSGQAVQAISMLKKMGPTGRLYSLERIAEKINTDKTKAMKGKNEPIIIPDEMKEDVLNAKTPEELDAAEQAVMKYINENTPSTFMDKVDAWRYLSMLGNPRTHIRNVVGNGLMYLARSTKNTLGAGIETVVRPKERTKAFYNPLSAENSARRSFAKSDFDGVYEEITAGGKYGIEQDTNSYQKIFKTPPLEWLRKKNLNALEAEDVIFMKNAYTSSLSQYLAANKINPETAAPEQIARGRQYAILEAQKATYREASHLADTLRQIEKNSTGAKIVLGGAVPFKKTPINITKRALEYSPAGIIKTISLGVRKVRGGDITAGEFIDSLSANLTGTGVVALGMFLASNGLLVAGGNQNSDREAYYDEMLGEQPYSLVIGDTSYSLDWAAPVAIPLFMGAELWEASNAEGTADVADTLKNLYTALVKVADPVMEMSMLQGINDALSGYNQDGLGGSIGQAASNTAESYVGQFVPTLLGQIARTMDPTTRASYASADFPLGKDAGRFLNRMENKIPGLREQNEVAKDLWGRDIEDENSLAVRAFKNFIFPGNISSEKITQVDKEISRLYERTGESSVIPKLTNGTITYGGETYRMTESEYARFRELQGKTAFSMLQDIFANEGYDALSDERKGKLVADVYKYANDIAKRRMFAGRGVVYEEASSTKEASEGGSHGVSPALYMMYYSATKEIANDDSLKKSEVADAQRELIGSANLTASQKVYLESVLVNDVIVMPQDKATQYYQAAIDAGIDGESYYDMFTALSSLSGDENYEKKEKVLALIDNTPGLTNEEKNFYYYTVMGYDPNRRKKAPEWGTYAPIEGVQARSTENEASAPQTDVLPWLDTSNDTEGLIRGTKKTTETGSKETGTSDTLPWEGASGTGAGYVRPVSGKITARFGQKGKYWGKSGHHGLDFSAAEGTPLQAVEGGTVTLTQSNYNGSIYGNRIEITHSDGKKTAYSHLSEMDVKPGNVVSTGQIIGKTGKTGRGSGAHLDFQVIVDGRQVNPLDYYNFDQAS